MDFIGTCSNALVNESRELVGKDSGKVWKRVASLAYMGGVCEAAVPEEVDMPKKGSTVSFSGKFSTNSFGTIEFVLQQWNLVK